MRGSSRAAAINGQNALREVIGSIDAADLAEQLFAAGSTVEGNATLRRALSDPSREGSDKDGLARRLFGGKVSDQATHVLAVLAGQRWSDERDLTDTIENFGVAALAESADRAGRLQQVEDELFRFERIVAGNPALRDALTNRQSSGVGKSDLVGKLLDGKAAPETVRLARQAVGKRSDKRLSAILESYLQLIAERRGQLTAVVTSAQEISAQERQRLAEALQRMYDRPIQVQPIVDPSVVGGMRVQIGDEVIDGTIATKLEGARRHFGG